MSLAVRVENLGKRFRLGELGRQTFLADWRAKLFGHEPADDAPGFFWALRDISFDVPQGQVVAVIGHNGAGKSTLLKILSSITSPTRGAVKLRGRVASLLEVGTGFHPDLTGRDNVFLNGAILGMSHAEIASKFDAIVAFSEIEKFIDTPVKRYSSGMRVRLAFAVAAHLEAEIMIVDEVLAVGDASFQQRCLGKMGEVSRGGRTVLFVSHNAAAVENLCTRGIVLNRGRLDFDGTQTEALRHYANRHLSSGGDLRTRTDRTGSGEVRATAIEFRDLAGRKTNAISGGEGVEVWVHYETRDGGKVPRLTCDLTVTTAVGAPLITQSNFFTDERLTDPPARGAIVCRLPSLPLIESAYRIDVGLYPLYRKRIPYDELTNAAELQVMQSDFFGGGKMPRVQSADGPLLIPGNWRLEAAEPALSP
jgi:lipopolysaccharide transport system ATP-binding protein